MITIPKCFECNNTNNIVYHHIVPQSLDGKNTIPLCQLCHDKVHQLSNPRNISISQLTKQGMQRAKQRGVKLGNPNWNNALKKAHTTVRQNRNDFLTEIRPFIRKLRNEGHTWKSICNKLNELGIIFTRLFGYRLG